MVLRMRAAALLAKTEAVEGTFEAPSASTDGILVENPTWQLNQNNISTDEVTGSLDPAADIPAGGTVTVNFDVYLKGSGVAITAPELDVLFRICAWKPTTQALAIGPDLPSAGTTSTATLDGTGTPFTAANDAYIGMPINIYDGTDVLARSVVTDWVLATKLLTIGDVLSSVINTGNDIEIPAHVLYKPVSAASDIPSASLRFLIDGLYHDVAGCRGTMTFSLDAGGAGKFSFSITGLFVEKDDLALPAITYPAFDVPKLVWRNDNNNGAFLMNGVRQGIRQFTFDNGNQLTNPADPNDAEGFDVGIITRRVMQGSINPRATLVADRDELSKYRAGTQTALLVRAGISTGNRFHMYIPKAQYTNYGYEDQDGIVAESLPFKCVGQNTGAYMAFY